jgi:flagellar assembly protein FliH
VIRRVDADRVTPLAMHDLRAATWTRHGGTAVRGDQATETMLERLADEARTAAEAQGYAAGWARGVRDAQVAAEQDRQAAAREADAREQAHARDRADAIGALSAAARSLRVRADETCRRLEDQAASLALAVTEAVLARTVPEISADEVVDRAVRLIDQDLPARVRVHPEVARAAACHARDGVTLVADPALGRADAVVELEDHALDLRVDRALQRVREALLEEPA